jgi:hypothetical protein
LNASLSRERRPEVQAIVEETRSRFLEKLLADVPVDERPPALRAALRGWIGLVEATSLDWVERHEISRATLRDLLADLLPEVVRLAMLHAGEEPSGTDGIRAPEAPTRGASRRSRSAAAPRPGRG